jgi:hypothetical protein
MKLICAALVRCSYLLDQVATRKAHLTPYNNDTEANRAMKLFPRGSAIILAAMSAILLPTAKAQDADDEGGQFSWIRTANTACAAGDFKQFFEAYARSAEVREEYTAETVSVLKNDVSTSVRSSEYRAFPIGMIDNSWVSSASAIRLAEGIDRPFEYLELEFSKAADSRVRIDYTQVKYALGSPSEGGDDMEAPNEKTRVGTPGYVLFYRTKDCWELVQHSIKSNAHD